MAVNSVRAVLLAPNDNVAAAIAAVDAAVPVVVTLNSSDETVLNYFFPAEDPVRPQDSDQGPCKGFAHYPLWLSHRRRDGRYKAWRSSCIRTTCAAHCHRHRPQKRRHARFVRPIGFVGRLSTSCLPLAHTPTPRTPWRPLSPRLTCVAWKLTVLRRLRPYLARIRSGGVDPKAQPAMEQRGGLLMIDGRNAIGHYVAAEAAKAVSDSGAGNSALRIALVRNSNHFGFAGYYATSDRRAWSRSES